jgi:hypothetical protein
MEHKKGMDLPEELFGFSRIKKKRYGSIYIEVFQNIEGEEQ